MTNLAPTQVEQLQSIGAYLRQVRQEQGLSLDVLANQIFIRPALLQALETGRTEQLPEAVFIQGFIRRYAEALGLDGKAISQEFLVTPVEVLPTPELLTPVTPSHFKTAATRGDTLPPESAAPLEMAQPGRVLEQPLPAAPMPPMRRLSLPLWLSLGALVLALGGGVWMFFGRSPAPVSRSPDRALEPVTESTLESPDQLETLESGESEPPGWLEAPIVVRASLSDRAWLSVVADGKTIYEGTPSRGYKATWTAQRTLVIRTGNAGGVSLAVNGDEPVLLGKSGVVRTLRLTPDSGAKELESSQ